MHGMNLVPRNETTRDPSQGARRGLFKLRLNCGFHGNIHSLQLNREGREEKSKATMSNHAMCEKRTSEDDLVSLAAKSCIPIAIVGIGFRGPAEAKNVNRLLEMIVNGREAWSPIPAKRWNNKAFYHPDNARHGSVSCVLVVE